MNRSEALVDGFAHNLYSQTGWLCKQTCEKRDGVSVSVINQDAKDAISAADAEKDGDVSSLAGSYFSTCRN